MKELIETNTTSNPRHLGLPTISSVYKQPNLNKLANLSFILILFVVCTKNGINSSQTC